MSMAGDEVDPQMPQRPGDRTAGITGNDGRTQAFLYPGGLAAVHASSRRREDVWDAMQRREVYGTSGPRILLWFDLLNAPGARPAPMGSVVELGEAPIFQVRAVGSLEQAPGCGPESVAALPADRLERLCRGECYRPTDRRRLITRIEVVRIRPRRTADEPIAGRIDDPWKVLPCPADPAGCQVAFTDPEHAAAGRDALYYVRAIEEPTPTVAADPLGCTRDEAGRCTSVDPCFGRPDDDDCTSPAAHRAWSSPIFVDAPRGSGRGR
jgi:hypothetical protein